MTEAEVKANRKRHRQKQRRKSFLTGLVIFFCLCIAVGAVLCLTVLFPVKTVTASGSKLYSSAQIVKAANLNEDDNMFTFSSTKTEQRIRKILPYVDTLKIKRVLPGTVELTVTDAAEYAAYLQKGQYFVVSRKGHVLNCYAEDPGLMLIHCQSAVCEVGQDVAFKDDSIAETVKILVDKMEKENISVNEIQVDDAANITAKVEGRLLVEFGTKNNISEKIAHLGGMIRSMEETRTGTVNLRMWSKDSPEGTFKAGAIENN